MISAVADVVSMEALVHPLIPMRMIHYVSLKKDYDVLLSSPLVLLSCTLECSRAFKI